MGPCLRRHRNRRLGRKRRCDNGDVVADQIGSHLRQTIIVPVGPAVFDRDVLAFDKAGFAQPLAERRDEGHLLVAKEKAYRCSSACFFGVIRGAASRVPNGCQYGRTAIASGE